MGPLFPAHSAKRHLPVPARWVVLGTLENMGPTEGEGSDPQIPATATNLTEAVTRAPPPAHSTPGPPAFHTPRPKLHGEAESETAAGGSPGTTTTCEQFQLFSPLDCGRGRPRGKEERGRVGGGQDDATPRRSSQLSATRCPRDPPHPSRLSCAATAPAPGPPGGHMPPGRAALADTRSRARAARAVTRPGPSPSTRAHTRSHARTAPRSGTGWALRPPIHTRSPPV